MKKQERIEQEATNLYKLLQHSGVSSQDDKPLTITTLQTIVNSLRSMWAYGSDSAVRYPESE